MTCRSQSSDRRVNNYAGIRSYNSRNLEVQLNYNPLSAGSIDILQVPLPFKHSYNLAASLYIDARDVISLREMPIYRL